MRSRSLDGISKPLPAVLVEPPPVQLVASKPKTEHFWLVEEVTAKPNPPEPAPTAFRPSPPTQSTRAAASPSWAVVPVIFRSAVRLSGELVVAAFLMFLVLSLPSYWNRLKTELTSIGQAAPAASPSSSPTAGSVNSLDPFSLASSPHPTASSSPTAEADPGDNEIDIPSLKLTVPLLSNVSLADSDQKMHQGVIQLAGTKDPTEDGVMLVVGHSSSYPWDDNKYGRIFASLPDVNIGDEVDIRYQNQRFRYKISDKTTVSPDHIVLPSTKELVLMTCVPVGTTKDRLLVTALPLDNLEKTS